jgi:hypothetical protein
MNWFNERPVLTATLMSALLWALILGWGLYLIS